VKFFKNLHPIIQVTYKTALVAAVATPVLASIYYMFKLILNHCIYNSCTLASHSIFSILSWPVLFLFIEISAIFAGIWFTVDHIERKNNPSHKNNQSKPSQKSLQTTQQKDAAYSYFQVLHTLSQDQNKN